MGNTGISYPSQHSSSHCIYHCYAHIFTHIKQDPLRLWSITSQLSHVFGTIQLPQRPCSVLTSPPHLRIHQQTTLRETILPNFYLFFIPQIDISVLSAVINRPSIPLKYLHNKAEATTYIATNANTY